MAAFGKKTVCGGSKGVKSEYDPQLSAAAAQSAATAAKAENFGETYFKSHILPMLEQQNAASLKSQGQLSDLYGINIDQAKKAAAEYNKYGLPAQTNFYNTVARYSAPQEMEREAGQARSDQEQAIRIQNQNMTRQEASLGIDPSSPAAIQAARNAAVENAANEAGAMNRARNTARNMGIQLAGDAATFSNTGAANINNFSNTAGGEASGAFGVANAALGGATSAANPVFQGYNTALSGYNNNMDAWAKIGAANINADAQTNWGTGLGKLFGTLGSAPSGSAFGGLMSGAGSWLSGAMGALPFI